MTITHNLFSLEKNKSQYTMMLEYPVRSYGAKIIVYRGLPLAAVLHYFRLRFCYLAPQQMGYFLVLRLLPTLLVDMYSDSYLLQYEPYHFYFNFVCENSKWYYTVKYHTETRLCAAKSFLL